MKKIESLESFSFSIGGYSTSTFKIRALYNIAQYESSNYYGQAEAAKNITYKDEQIQELVKALNSIQILKWEPKYDSGTLDGIQWELKLNYNRNKEKKVYGSNMYPGLKEDSEEPTEIFEQMLFAFAAFIQEPSFFLYEYIDKSNNLSL